ncbi:MAG: hypothetical protein SCAL_001279 [Candidatus Syntrophoarchaeum caldarius]|uniref:Uncharacterized protein n=1 Tax=Candidatus Syntropharchaeum caldarium TaxID=1838285 RepID=A0A1F2P9H5_9EURY|nr:MAG: hypothetical protein SCAL_001279 [Candidatus Syntrophoarchaeum caldarius]
MERTFSNKVEHDDVILLLNHVCDPATYEIGCSPLA